MKTFVILLALIGSFANAAPYQLADAQHTFHANGRALDSRIYYPTEDSGPQHVLAANPVFAGIPSRINAPVAQGRFPLVILSHGSGGNNASQAWLAKALVEQGIIVAAANHPGSTTGNSLPAQSARLWLQTEDMSALIGAMLDDARWSQRIDANAIGVIGHSKGGYSAIALVGGRLDLRQFIHGCHRAPHSANCQFYTQAKVELRQLSAQRFNHDYQDRRVRFAIALDPGMAPYLLPASLGSLSAPLLIVEAQRYLATADGLGGRRWRSMPAGTPLPACKSLTAVILISCPYAPHGQKPCWRRRGKALFVTRQRRSVQQYINRPLPRYCSLFTLG
ncbi:alpha/beta hydrolase family protein [Serratia odorifera]|uniref:Peptidase S9 prolyl oligopeptidase catalytic domain-containing protein n=2 Tax=Serratia odorifera TaxID=618 RepID=D4E2K9_SEROD|nr:prolyl oligopeptidase family serine peptidase [Serratia odorifera]EFE95971.1 hypothetical protein HMPREF0758_2409 [Serratia odorifera DSM 4582]VDZ58985.1 Predicted dienelactone hydrolase [Serratia odorifera]